MATPTSMGRYKILSEIGRGAMGVVYLAHDPRIDRHVAIKTIHALDVLPAAEAEEIRMRFTREAQAAGRLQHPGIVTIFDVGEHEGTWFIAMEYIEGETLEAFTRKQSLLPHVQVLDLILQACDALDYAHQQHIVHRDIKPANLMLLRNGKLKITDFGLAKNPHTSLTQEGILIGTPNYMSPEQVMGRPLDGRSDLFSLAAVLYELLTGERPFPGDTVTTIIYRILNEQPAQPQMVNSLIPPAIAPVLITALAKDPERRYQTGAALSAALQGQQAMMLAEGVGAARPVTLTRPATKSTAGAPLGRAASVSKAGPSPTARASRESGGSGGARSKSAPRASMSKSSRVRTGLILLGAPVLVLLLPAGVTIEDRWGQGDSEGKPPFYRTASIVTGVAGLAGGGTGSGPAGPGTTPSSPAGTSGASPASPSVTLPGGADSMTITWKTSPPGGRIYIDDVEAPNGALQLPRSDTASHTVVAENDCFIEKVPWQAGKDKDGATHTVSLKTPKVAQVQIASQPAGAAVLLDGRDTGKVTPTEISLPICKEHTVTLRKEGHKESAVRIEKPAGPLNVTLARLSVGFVKVAAPYPVSIYEGGKLLGKSGSPIKLTGGDHKLVLKNDDLFVERTLNVTVRADSTVSPETGLPGVGKLTVLASPSNCTIFVNGRDLGPPPINDLELAAGTYSVRATYLPTGESKESTVVVTAGGGARIPFKFNP